MTFEQLEYFLAAADQDTFFDAAETLHISQSALSKQIMKLERELDIVLFNRSRRKAALTDAGIAFYSEAETLLSQYHQTLETLDRFRSKTTKTLCIGTLPILTHYHLTSLFKQFSDTHPHVNVMLEEVEETDLLKGFESGKYAFILTRRYMLDGNACEITPLSDDRLCVVLSSAHKLAHMPSLTLKELAKEPLILMNHYTSIYQLCMELFQEENITPHILRTARVESILSAVSINEGISLLAESNFQIFKHENITVIPLEPSVNLPVVIARKTACSHRGKLIDELILFLTSRGDCVD